MAANSRKPVKAGLKTKFIFMMMRMMKKMEWVLVNQRSNIGMKWDGLAKEDLGKSKL